PLWLDETTPMRPLLFALVALAAAGAVLADQAPPETYYPLKPGSRWDYRVRDGTADLLQTVRVTGEEKTGDGVVALVEVVTREAPTGKEAERYTERVAVRPDG